MAKHVRDMNETDYADAKKKLTAPDSVQHAGLTDWKLVATTIRGMSPAAISAFEREYGISIVPNTHQQKRYADMTPEEQEKFRGHHRITI